MNAFARFDWADAEFYGRCCRLYLNDGSINLVYEFARLAAHHALDHLEPMRKYRR